MYLRTSKELIQWINDNITLNNNETVEDAAIWFTAMQEARSFSDCSWKDTAHILMDGIKPMNNIQAVDDYLETLFDEDDEEFWDEIQDMLIESLQEHFGQ